MYKTQNGQVQGDHAPEKTWTERKMQKKNVVTLDQMIVDGHKTRLTSTKVKYRASHERKYNVACPNLESEQSSSFEKNPKGHPQIKAFQSFGALFELI